MVALSKIIVLFVCIQTGYCFGDTIILKIFDLIAWNIFGYQPITIQVPPKTTETYDFIIVGGGSGGAVVANRLSENPNWKILLLEAGTTANEFTKIPILAPVFTLTPYIWHYLLEHQSGACLGMDEEICAWPRGKVLGGTSAINYMIYARGNPKDYDIWSENSPSWNFDEALKYFKKSENCQFGANCDNDSHQKNGYLTIEYSYKNVLADTFIQAGIELGNKEVDYNSRISQMGFSRFQATQKHGRRESADKAFLDPIKNQRKNLKIVLKAHVTRIIIDNETNVATGVEYYINHKKYMAKAEKEVILSAGIFNSPQLLMLSGIGPKKDLDKLKIPVVSDLPVGETIYDHLAYVGLSFRINQTIEPRYLLLEPNEILNWTINGKGAYTSLGGNEAIAYVNVGANPDPEYPDIELIFSGAGSIETDFGLVVANSIRMKRTIFNTVFKPQEAYPTWTALVILLHPKSKGHLKLKSSNPFDAPLLHSGYFTDPEGYDLKTFLAGIRFMQKLSETHAFQRYNSTINTIPIPGCEMNTYDSDDYWYCAIRTLSTTAHRQVGTCKMGPEDDQEAVVNEQLQVYGVKRLRVIDSSIIPVTLSAATNAPTIMIAEKASDIIKEYWSTKK